MKKFSKILSVALLVALVLSLGVANAFAASITVVNKDPGTDTNSATETYIAYKVFDAVKATGTTIETAAEYTQGVLPQTISEGGAITYTIGTNSPWFNKLFTESGTTATAVSGNSYFTATYIPGSDYEVSGTTYHTYQVSATENMKTEENARTCASWLLGLATAQGSGISGTELDIGINDVSDGYYLVTSSLGTNLGLATTDMPMTVVEKNKYPNIDKTQKDGEAAANNAPYSDNEVDVQVGDTINYQVVVWVPASAGGDITVTDTMSSGLTPAAANTVAVAVGSYNPDTKAFTAASPAVELTAADVVVADGTSPITYNITIHPTGKVLGKYVQFTFTATVNKDAIVDTTKENDVLLTYSNYSQPDTVKFNVYATGFVKYDGKNNTVNPDAENKLPSNAEYLAGAEFQLLDSDGTTVIPVSRHADGYYYPDNNGTAVITSVANAESIKIRGLDNHTYYLKETKAPSGFNLITGNVELVVMKDTATKATGTDTITLATLLDANVAKVQNNKGTVLPSTGGIGTTIFYVVGGVLVLAAIILLVTKKRMSE